MIKNNSNEEEEDDEWTTEAKLLRRLDYKYIVKYHDHFNLMSKELNMHHCIITEYCEVNS